MPSLPQSSPFPLMTRHPRIPIPSPFAGPLHVRFFPTYGDEYQPSTLKRKRRYGFLKRVKTYAGRIVLRRRMLKGRRHMAH
ncbi:hypothetical protein SmJEL517_g04237 [Synchytrium microbalum]|uniref:Large ribosomal subunit protein bL34m n=1 Tax=Synchytrium microbalum TaxID=1806994 RepID=A0A507C017_9FUNG|nr:uncharacterized protein SmJEL517_g04237 [Synchytrium microbalum]TPX32731.1 hypothetical protein SmJEL517_g04237 [Synchytrium microbalum]